MEQVRSIYANEYGMVKIIPPQKWKPRLNGYEEYIQKINIQNPIQQNPQGKMGTYQFKHISLKSMSYKSFINQFSSRQQILKQKTLDQTQDLFWKNIANNAPVYGADLDFTLMDESAGQWQLNNLDTILNKAISQRLKGVNSSYCYIGSWKALFCWHKQDLDLSAINYMHLGKSKFWYCIQADDSCVLQQQARKTFFQSSSKCSQFLRHKTSMINPYQLKKKHQRLKITKTEQKAGQFIVAFSGAYHCGFNFGINIAEAVNFATSDWLQKIGKIKYCLCKKSSVKISPMMAFDNLLKFQQYSSDTNILKLKNQLYLESDSKLNKHKRIAKKNKKSKLKKDINLDDTNYEKLLQIEKFQIQCDRCDAWHQLSLQNIPLKQKQQFYCEMIEQPCREQQKDQQDK